jgi:hypothetical protein
VTTTSIAARALGAAAVHAWLLALTLVVTGHPERSRALRVGVGALLVATWARAHLMWRGFALFSRAGLSLDATGVAMAWANGLFLLAGWGVTAVALERLSTSSQTDQSSYF